MSGASVVGVPPVMLMALIHCRMEIPRKYTLAGRWNCSQRFFTMKLRAVYCDPFVFVQEAMDQAACHKKGTILSVHRVTY